jgi:hypothetical protein
MNQPILPRFTRRCGLTAPALAALGRLPVAKAFAQEAGEGEHGPVLLFVQSADSRLSLRIEWLARPRQSSSIEDEEDQFTGPLRWHEPSINRRGAVVESQTIQLPSSSAGPQPIPTSGTTQNEPSQ